jgi:kumamolisin
MGAGEPSVAIVAAATTLVVTAAAVLLTVHRITAPVGTDLVEGPYARMLAESVNLGPASGQVRLTAALHKGTEPVLLTDLGPRPRLISALARETTGPSWRDPRRPSRPRSE